MSLRVRSRLAGFFAATLVCFARLHSRRACYYMVAHVPQMLGELVTAGLGPEHVDTLYELCERVRAAEQDKDPPPAGRLKAYAAC